MSNDLANITEPFLKELQGMFNALKLEGQDEDVLRELQPIQAKAQQLLIGVTPLFMREDINQECLEAAFSVIAVILGACSIASTGLTPEVIKMLSLIREGLA